LAFGKNRLENCRSSKIHTSS